MKGIDGGGRWCVLGMGKAWVGGPHSKCNCCMVWDFGWGEFSRHTSLKVGTWRRVKFWEHICCGEVRLRDAYPSIFQLVADGDAAVMGGSTIS